MQRVAVSWTSLAQGIGRRRGSARASAAAASIPSGGASRYIQKAVHTPEGSAEAKLRAGFMPKPETGASMSMKQKMCAPAA